MNFFYFLALGGFLFLSLLLCGIVLLQEGKSGGLGGSFGGDTSNSVFGTSTPEVLKKITAYLAAVYICMCLFLSFWTETLEHRVSVLPTMVNEEVSGD